MLYHKGLHGFVFQVDAMKVGAKEMKKAYKNVKIDQIEVNMSLLYKMLQLLAFQTY